MGRKSSRRGGGQKRRRHHPTRVLSPDDVPDFAQLEAAAAAAAARGETFRAVFVGPVVWGL